MSRQASAQRTITLMCQSPRSFLVACDIGTSKICVLIGEQNAARLSRRDRQGRVPPTGAPARATSSTSTPRSRPSSGPPKRRKSWPGSRFPGPGWGFPAPTCGPSTAGGWSPWPARTGRSPRRTSTRVIDAARGVQIPQDHEVVHVVPRDFAVDGQDGVGGPRRHDRQPARGRRPRRHGARGGDPEHRHLHEQGGHRGRPARARAVRRRRGGPHAGREGARDLPDRHRGRNDRGRGLPEGDDRAHRGRPDRRRPLHQRSRRRPAGADHATPSGSRRSTAAPCAARWPRTRWSRSRWSAAARRSSARARRLSDILQPRAEELLGLDPRRHQAARPRQGGPLRASC